jgi:hypothetical protein
MNRGRAPNATEEYAEMHLRIMVEQAVRCGKSEHEIETLLKKAEAEDRQALGN